jgi:hypothetical protein
MSKTQNENQTNSASLDYSEENFTDYSIKVIEYLCKRYKKAVTNGQPTDFNIDEIWQSLAMIILIIFIVC